MRKTATPRGLTPYEAWYRNGGVGKYARVFAENDEKAREVELVSRALAARSPFGGKKEIRVLDIGCGTGRFSVMLLHRLARDHGFVVVTADLVDLSADAFRRFRQEAARESLPCRIAVGREVEKSWRAVRETDLSPPYDLIIADHVFYGEPLDAGLVHRLAGLVSGNGVVMVALQTADCDLSRMRREIGIRTNAAGMFRRALEQARYPYQEMLYESRLPYREDLPDFRDWFSASARADPDTIERALAKYRKTDSNGRAYFDNQAVMFLFPFPEQGASNDE